MQTIIYRGTLFDTVCKIMKYSAILSFLIGCCSTLGLAENTYSQVLEKPITLSTGNMSLPAVLDEISRVSDTRFVLASQKESAKKSRVNVKNEKLGKVLDKLLAPYSMTYTASGSTIILKHASPKPVVNVAPKQEAEAEKSEQPEIKLFTGKIVDKNGQALPGASVVVKGTERGTVSDVDGSFSINVDNGETLVVSFIGFLKKEIIYRNESTLNIQLLEDVAGLEELVVVGYGTQKKINVTGAVSAIEAKDLDSRPLTNLSSGLQGLMAGVTVVNSNALPGQNGSSIRIRGVGTLGDANPLIVVDGIPGGDLNILNPADIESISVLKDAASSSIYGVRGANGVIVVTTKKGKEDSAPNISYNGYIGMQTPTALPKFVGSPEYMQLLNESQVNVGRNPTYTDADIEIARNGSDPNYFANTNWIDEIYKKSAPQQSHNLSINGGAKNLNYYVSYGYLKEGGMITGDNYNAQRHNVRLRLNTTIVDRLHLDANLGYIDRGFSGSAEDIDSDSGPLYASHQILPLVPVRFTTGGWGYIGGQRNPVAVTTDGGTNRFNSQEFTGNLSATLDLFDGLKLRGQYGLIRSNSYRSIFSKTINYFSPTDGSLIYQTNPQNKIDVRDYTSLYQTMLGFLEYDKIFAAKHTVKGLLAVSQEENVSNYVRSTRTNLASQDVESINLGTENQLNEGSASQNALRSFFGRFNYGFKEKYLAEFNFRYDGSSRFAPDRRWDWFTSGSVGWVFSEEGFFDRLRNVIELGKIRLSYGTQGNDKVRIGGTSTILNYGYLSTLGPVNNTFPIGNALTIGYRQSNIPNPFLTWESVVKQNAGIDLAMMKGRMGITFDYYIQNTNNILLNVPLPDVLGVGTTYPPQNAGKVENSGWEVQVSWKDQISDFRYGANFNLSDVRNKVTSLGGVPPTYGDRIRIVGQPIDAFYGLVADRIAQVEDFNFDAGTNKYTPKFPAYAGDPVAPGDIIYKDLNGDGRITLDDDRQVIGNAIPRFNYGFRGELGWKGIDFSFFLQGVGKADGYIQGAARHALINEGSLPQEIHRDRWTPQNTDASYPRLTYQQAYNQRLSSFWLENAAYLRLKNIQIGYTIPEKFTKKARVSRLRIYASADNLLTKTDFFYGYDPESPVTSGGFYPQVKTFVAGISVNFK
ncbi:MAG TPA: TonB-dependent receptor [Dyadobacter sp.]|nr:TonB-dependent receptor [Dyadobacter sp.]